MFKDLMNEKWKTFMFGLLFCLSAFDLGTFAAGWFVDPIKWFNQFLFFILFFIYVKWTLDAKKQLDDALPDYEQEYYDNLLKSIPPNQIFLMNPSGDSVTGPRVLLDDGDEENEKD